MAVRPQPSHLFVLKYFKSEVRECLKVLCLSSIPKREIRLENFGSHVIIRRQHAKSGGAKYKFYGVIFVLTLRGIGNLSNT